MIFEQSSFDIHQIAMAQTEQSSMQQHGAASPRRATAKNTVLQESNALTIDPFDDLILCSNRVAEIMDDSIPLNNICIDGTFGFHESDGAHAVSNSSGEESSVEEPQKKKRRSNKGLKFRSYQAKQWQDRFNDLVDFQKEKKHCLVPHTYPANPALASWVKRQRYQYKLLLCNKRSSMTPDRIYMLEEYSFIWDSHETAWQESLEDLLDYKEENGNCLVPSNYPANPKIATWVKCQRRQYKLFMDAGRPSNMTVERITLLEKYGFEWELRASSYSTKTAAELEAKALKHQLHAPYQYYV